MTETITEDYLAQQRLLHENPNYGVASLSFAPLVADLIRQIGAKSVSDYGAGKKRLFDGLRDAGIELAQYLPYDPVFPEYGEPQPADLVCCIDVLEHIEPHLVENVIKDLSRITTKFGFFSIHMGPAGKILSDGRNAHLIQKPSSWWLKLLTEYFEVLHLQSHQMMGRGIWLVVSPRDSLA
jgi:hypothetical protein